jgi:hypothetical protein
MAKSTVREAALLEDIEPYSHAVLAYVDDTGFPINVATNFRPNPQRGTIELDLPSVPSHPNEGQEVNVLFSHIRPYPGVGYDQRRYVCVWGRVSAARPTRPAPP